MSTSASGPRSVVVVGAGIAGLAAAAFLRELGGPDLRITVLESGPTIGGKLRLIDVAGLTLDGGAEALLARRPEAVDLVRRVGLGEDLVHPVSTAAGVWTRGMVRPLPTGHVFGIPTDLRAAARSGVLSRPGLVRAALERVLPVHPGEADVSVGAFVRRRWGGEVVDRLVDPLVGGVYAGHADGLSLAAAVPPLAQAAREGLRVRPPAASTGPVFAGIRGGVGRLPAAVAAAANAEIRTGVTVRQLERLPDGWRLVTGGVPDPVEFRADAVVLAVLASAAARLLHNTVPAAAGELGTVEHASAGRDRDVGAARGRDDQAVARQRFPRAGRRGPADQGGHELLGEMGLDRAGRGRRRGRPGFGRPAGRDCRPRRRGHRAGRAGAGRSGRGGRAARRAARQCGDAVGRGSSAVRRRAPRPGRHSGPRRSRRRCSGLAVCGAAYDGIGIAACIASARQAQAAAAVLRPAAQGVNGRRQEGTDERTVPQRRQRRSRPVASRAVRGGAERRRPLHDVVGVQAREPARRRRPHRGVAARSTPCSTSWPTRI